MLSLFEMKPYKLFLLSVVLLSACSFNDEQVNEGSVSMTEEQQTLVQQEQQPQVFEVVEAPQQRKFHSHQKISDFSDRLAHHLMKNINITQWQSAIVIASFVKFDDQLKESNPLGNLISENLLGQIQQYGVPVVDLHMKGWMEVTPTGDYVFSRDADEIMVGEMAKYVLAGVMIPNERGVMINARIVEFANQRIISTASVLIPHYLAEGLY
jgi:TolB-like protein